jgi:hypothetical protein
MSQVTPPKPPSGGFLFGLAEDDVSIPNEARFFTNRGSIFFKSA